MRQQEAFAPLYLRNRQQAGQASRGGIMSEGAQRSVIPFLVDDERGRARRTATRPSGCISPKPCAWPRRSSSPAPSRSAKSSSPRGCPTASTSPAVMAELQADLCAARRQSGAGRRRLGVPHRRRPRLPDEPRRGAAEEAVARGARSAGDHRLPPAGHARRDRGHPRRRDLQGHARHAAGDRMGAHARPPPHARPPGHLRHHGQVPRPFRAGGDPRPARHRGTEGRRAAVGAHAVQFLRCRCRRPIPTCSPRTRIR